VFGCTIDWGPGAHCEHVCHLDACSPTCVPDSPNTCDTVDCGPGSTCVMICPLDMPGGCFPTCMPTSGGDPGSCTGDVLCDALPPACPTGTIAGIGNGCWTGYCIPQPNCGPHDPGTCAQATCLAPQPVCPAGTVAGVLNGCYTGYCIPASSCPQAACEQLADEASCTARGDCRAVYTGDNCTCDANGCTCQDLTFARCDASVVAL
jgi:hypothetical protein